MCELTGGHRLKSFAARPIVGGANKCGADPAIFETHGYYGVQDIKPPVVDTVLDVSDGTVFVDLETV